MFQNNLKDNLKKVESKYYIDKTEQSQKITKLFYSVLLDKKLVKDETPKQKRLKI